MFYVKLCLIYIEICLFLKTYYRGFRKKKYYCKILLFKILERYFYCVITRAEGLKFSYIWFYKNRKEIIRKKYVS